MVAIRDTVRELIAMQMEETVTDEEIQKQQEKLNQVYDTYTASMELLEAMLTRGHSLMTLLIVCCVPWKN